MSSNESFKGYVIKQILPFIFLTTEVAKSFSDHFISKIDDFFLKIPSTHAEIVLPQNIALLDFFEMIKLEGLSAIFSLSTASQPDQDVPSLLLRMLFSSSGLLS